MSAPKMAVTEAAPALGFSFQCQIDDRRILTAQTHVPQDMSADDLNKMLDKVADAMDRMVARYRMPIAERELKIERAMMEESKKQAALVEERAKQNWTAQNRRTPFKLSDREESEKRNFQTTLAKHTEMLADKELEVEHCRRMLNGTGAGAGA